MTKNTPTKPECKLYVDISCDELAPLSRFSEKLETWFKTKNKDLRVIAKIANIDYSEELEPLGTIDFAEYMPAFHTLMVVVDTEMEPNLRIWKELVAKYIPGGKIAYKAYDRVNNRNLTDIRSLNGMYSVVLIEADWYPEETMLEATELLESVGLHNSLWRYTADEMLPALQKLLNAPEVDDVEELFDRFQESEYSWPNKYPIVIEKWTYRSQADLCKNTKTERGELL